VRLKCLWAARGTHEMEVKCYFNEPKPVEGYMEKDALVGWYRSWSYVIVLYIDERWVSAVSFFEHGSNLVCVIGGANYSW